MDNRERACAEREASRRVLVYAGWEGVARGRGRPHGVRGVTVGVGPSRLP